MIYALWLFGILAILGWLVAGLYGPEAISSGDDFGAGLLAVAAFAIGVTSTLLWLVLAAFHWWPG